MSSLHETEQNHNKFFNFMKTEKIIEIPKTSLNQMLSFNGNKGQCFSHISKINEIKSYSNPVFVFTSLYQNNVDWHSEYNIVNLPITEAFKSSFLLTHETEMIVEEYKHKCEAESNIV